MASFKAKFPAFQELFAKTTGGPFAPPSGARVNAAHLFAHGHIKTRAVSKLSVTVKQEKLLCIITGKH